MMLCENVSVNAETFLVEAATQLMATVSEDAGGEITLTLADELNHGISDAELTVELIRIEDKAQKTWHLTTDHSGCAKVHADLDPGTWRGSAFFEGQIGWLPSETALHLTTEPCRAETEIHLADGGLYDIESDIVIEITRKKSACSIYPARWMIALGHRSQSVEMAPGETSTRVIFKTGELLPGQYTVMADLSEGRRYRRESVKAVIIVYENAFESMPVFYEDYRGIHARADLSEELKHLPEIPSLPAILSMTPLHGSGIDICRGELYPAVFRIMKTHPVRYEASNDSTGRFVFDISEKLSPCMWVELERKSSGRSQKHADLICFPQAPSGRSALLILLAGGAVILTAGGILYARKRRKMRKAGPASPSKQHSVPVKVDRWDNEIKNIPLPAGNTACMFVCADSRTRQIIDPAEIHITIGGKPAASQWPCSVTASVPIRIEHEEYMPWQGKLKHPGRHMIYLTGRREYAIECFECVCNRHGHEEGWGCITPEALRREMFCGASPAIRGITAEFCDDISKAVYGKDQPTDDTLECIYRLSQKL